MENDKDLHYKRLSELIFDEEQVVTSVSIANELKISGYKAQCLLRDYVHDIEKRKSEDFHVSYLLCGILKENKGVAVYLVKGDDLKEKKCLFDNISTEIVYSIQSGKLIDFNTVASVNSVHGNSIGLLVTKNCKKREFKSRKLPILESAANTVKHNVVKNTEPSTSAKSEKTVQGNGKNHTQSSQKQQKLKQNGGIASFFTKGSAKPQSNANSVNTAQNEISKQTVNGDGKENSNKEQENIQKDFGRDEKIKVDSDDKKDVGSDKKTKVDSVDEKDLKSDEKTKVVSVDHKDHNITASKEVDKQTSKKRKKGNKNNGPNKKRKRIQEICDSDSSDIFDGDEENEDIIEMSDDEPVNVPAVNPVPAPRNKKRKAVDRTYEDEEGFIVTTTEYIYESASEDEKDISKSKPEAKVLPLRKNEKSNVETKLSGNKGRSNKKQVSANQPTLMSFFKKN